MGKNNVANIFETQIKQLEPTLLALDKTEKAAQQAASIAAEKRKAAIEAVATADGDRSLRELQSELDAALSAQAQHRERTVLSNRVARVERIADRLQGVELQLDSAGPGTMSDVTSLQALCERERELELRLESSEMIVSVEPLHDLQVTWLQNDGQQVENVRARDRKTRRVDGLLTLSMKGVGQVEIRGPRGDAAMLSEQLREVKMELRAFQERLGTRDALELQKNVDAKRQADADRQRLTAELADVLDGSTAEDLFNDLQRLGSDANGLSTAQRVEELRAELKHQNAAFELLRERAVGAMRVLTEEEALASKAAENAQTRRRRFEEETLWPLRAELDDFARTRKSDADRRLELDEAYAARHEAEHKRDKADSAYSPFALASDPTTELASKEQTAERLAGDATEAEFRVREFQSELRRISEQEPGSKLAELHEERERLSIDLEEQERSEQAVRLLHDFVRDADARRVGSFAEPILARVRPWFEQATGRSVEALGLGANNEMNDLRFSGVPRAVDFDELSQGAGDQLALLIRLAFAAF